MCPSAAGAGPDVPALDSICMDSDSPDSSDCESDILLGLLESLDSEMLLGELPWNQEQEVSDEADSIPASPSPTVGTPSIKLEAINELIRFDHVYTKPLCSEQDIELETESNVVIKTEEASLNTSCVIPISVKEEFQEEETTPVLAMQSVPCPENNVEKTGSQPDAGSDSGYEGCSSPFSDMSSPLNCDQPWEDSFTSELFPQLLNVQQSGDLSPLADPTLFWNPSPEFEDEPF